MMKKMEIRRFGVLSAWKVTTYMMILPAVIFVLAGIGTILIGVIAGRPEMIFMGVLVALIYPIAFLVVYGLLAMLAALIYNWLAGKFGGLELTLKEDQTAPPQ